MTTSRYAVVTLLLVHLDIFSDSLPSLLDPRVTFGGFSGRTRLKGGNPPKLTLDETVMGRSWKRCLSNGFLVTHVNGRKEWRVEFTVP